MDNIKMVLAVADDLNEKNPNDVYQQIRAYISQLERDAEAGETLFREIRIHALGMPEPIGSNVEDALSAYSSAVEKVKE